MLRRLRLKFWLRCMHALDQRGHGDSELYQWCTRRAMHCNMWRTIKWPKI